MIKFKDIEVGDWFFYKNIIWIKMKPAIMRKNALSEEGDILSLDKDTLIQNANSKKESLQAHEYEIRTFYSE